MTEVTATDAARNFSDLLDAVEHRGERFTVVRRGRVVARLEPAEPSSGAAVKRLLAGHRADGAWAQDVLAMRGLLEVEDRS